MFGLEFFEPFPIDRGGVVACSRIDLTTAWYFENENIFNGFRRNHKANIVKHLRDCNFKRLDTEHRVLRRF